MIEITFQYKKCLIEHTKLIKRKIYDFIISDNYINNRLKYDLGCYFYLINKIGINGICLMRVLPEWLIIEYLPRLLSHEILHYILDVEHDLLVSAKLDNTWVQEMLKDYGIYSKGEI